MASGLAAMGEDCTTTHFSDRGVEISALEKKFDQLTAVADMP
jgi:hypothetical protein